MNKSLWISLCAVFAIIGCDAKPTETSSTATGGGEQTTGATSGTQPVKPKLDELPSSVKHDAFEYYGLGNTKTMDVKLSGAQVAQQTGGISVELEKVEGEKAFFKVVRTGAVGDSLGTDLVMVDKDGVHATGNTMGKLTPASYLALPADLTPGKTWNVKNKIEQSTGQQVEENSIYKVEGIRDFKTKTGMQKALLVTSTGDASVTTGGSTQKMKSTTKSWYLKGVGQVKTEITFTIAGKPANTITVEVSE